jgi:adenine-specific DNA-methyltransferase
MSNKKDELSGFSYDYYKTTDITHRQKFGQYFTAKSLRDIALGALPSISRAIDVAELSCGSGEFIDSILEKYPLANVEGFEIEQALATHCCIKYRERRANVIIYAVDTLRHRFDKKYKFVVGNPPYFEMVAKDHPDLMKQYKDVISGRANIYSMFIKLGIDLLEDNGYLSYVVPTSMLNGAYFSKLREYIIQRCSIVDIIIKDDGHFDDALQNVMILVLKKCPNDGRFIFSHNGITIFTPEWEYLKKVFSQCDTLSSLGFKVKTGTIVWNQRKKDLSDNPQDTLLIWSDNITEQGIDYNAHTITEGSGKFQYIKNIDKTENPPVILVNRITGVGAKACLRACFLNTRRPFVCENHVNVISGTNDSMNLESLLKHIQSPQAIEVMRKITGNTQVSKTELEKLFPIWL